MIQKQDTKKNPQKTCLFFLAMFYLILMAGSQILSYRYINFFGFTTIASVIFIPFTYAITDLITENYDYDTSMKVVGISMLCLFVFSLFMYIAQILPYQDKFNSIVSSYSDVFSKILRIYFSNLIGIIIGMSLNCYILSKWKWLISSKYFYMRSLGSSVVGELTFTYIVISIVQYGLIPWSQIIEIATVSFAIKVAFTFISSACAALLKPLVIRIDGADMSKYSMEITPIKIIQKAIKYIKIAYKN